MARPTPPKRPARPRGKSPAAPAGHEGEAAFLANYDPTSFPRPSLAVDLVITSVDDEGRLIVLLVKRKEHPFLGWWSLPGGFVREREPVPAAAARVLREKTSLGGIKPDELRVFSEPDRDPRTWVVSIAHLALVPSDRLASVRAGGAAEDARFWVVEPEGARRGFRLSARAGTSDPAPAKLAFDHDHVMRVGLARLREKVSTSTLAFGLLPARFTLSEAQRMVEAIVGRQLDKAAFRTKVLTLGLVRPTDEERRGGAHRPAKLYVAAHGWADEPSTK